MSRRTKCSSISFSAFQRMVMFAGAYGGTVAPGPIVGPGVTRGVGAGVPGVPGTAVPGTAELGPGLPCGADVEGGRTTLVGSGPGVTIGPAFEPRHAAWSTATPPPKAMAIKRTTASIRPGPAAV